MCTDKGKKRGVPKGGKKGKKSRRGSKSKGDEEGKKKPLIGKENMGSNERCGFKDLWITSVMPPGPHSRQMSAAASRVSTYRDGTTTATNSHR